MIIYGEVLIAVNMFIDFFILLLCAKINKQNYKTYRIILGAFMGGILSLCIFLESNVVVVDLIINALSAVILVLTAFGYKTKKVFLRNVFVLFISTYVFAGIIFGVWVLFRPKNIFINNSIVYFDVSVVFLVLITAAIYFLITFASSVLKKEAITASNSILVLYLANKEVKLNAIFDTGNSLIDPLGNEEIVVVNRNKLRSLCECEINIINLPSRYRVIPCRTVSGDTLLEGVRCDKMTIEVDGKNYTFDNPIAVIPKTELGGDFDAILNSEILLKTR